MFMQTANLAARRATDHPAAPPLVEHDPYRVHTEAAIRLVCCRSTSIPVTPSAPTFPMHIGGSACAPSLSTIFQAAPTQEVEATASLWPKIPVPGIAAVLDNQPNPSREYS